MVFNFDYYKFVERVNVFNISKTFTFIVDNSVPVVLFAKNINDEFVA